MEKTWKNIFISYCHPENNNLLFEIFHFATRANEYVYRWTNQRHLKHHYATTAKNLKT